MRFPLVLASIMAIFLSACGDGGGTGGSGGTGGDGGTSGGSGGTGGDGGGSGGTGAGDVDCLANPPVFPTFDKACVIKGDCVLKYHMVDCCGTLHAIAISATDSDVFDAAEGVCSMQYPACGCAGGPTVAEDGQSAPDMSAIDYDCTNGSCSSFVP